MRVRSIDALELVRFAETDDWIGTSQRVREYLEGLWRRAESRPEWCFVADERGLFVGRVVYWALRSLPPMEMDLLALPWKDRYLEVGPVLLRESLAYIRTSGSAGMTFNIHIRQQAEGAEREPQRAKCIEVLERSGFSFGRESLRFEWRPTAGVATSSDRLLFKTLQQVGDATFIDAIQRVAQGTLDRSDRIQDRKLGPEESARQRFLVCRALRGELTWWQVAYDKKGELVGLVIPSKNDGGPIIAYIGVVPEHRGQGYVNDLLAQGTRILADEGAQRIRADTDSLNEPMAAAFRRAGYQQFAVRLTYRIDLG